VSATVREIMNPELFNVAPHMSVAITLGGILAMEVTAAAVLDGDQRPLGVVSLRDLVEAPESAPAADRMTSPAVVVRADARIIDAARLMGETGHRHLVVVDDSGRAIGMVSAIDVVRVFAGLPARHPASFPHLDMKTGITWSDDIALDPAHLEAAPQGPGLILLVHDAPGMPRRIVWVESAGDARTRLMDMLSGPQESHALARWLEDRAALRFRVGVACDPGALRRGLEEGLQEKERDAVV
jgi:hypothetical protein